MLDVEAELSRRVLGHSTNPNHVARFEQADAERAVFQAWSVSGPQCAVFVRHGRVISLQRPPPDCRLESAFLHWPKASMDSECAASDLVVGRFFEDQNIFILNFVNQEYFCLDLLYYKFIPY